MEKRMSDYYADSPKNLKSMEEKQTLERTLKARPKKKNKPLSTESRR